MATQLPSLNIAPLLVAARGSCRPLLSPPADVSASNKRSLAVAVVATAAAAATSRVLLPVLPPIRCRKRIHRTLVRKAAVRNQPASNSESNMDFRTREFEGKGIGVVAERSFACGELIIAESPIFRFKSEDTAKSLHQRFDALPRHEQDALMDLHDGFATEKEGKTLEGVVRTNAHTCDDTRFDMVVVANISRFNHSCEPNCEISWDNRLKEEHVYASRAIEQGEELCIGYVDIIAPAADRQQDLKQSFGFQCACSVCSNGLNPDSDERRSRLRELWQQLEREGPDDPDDGLFIIGDMLRLYATEGIYPQSLKCQACEAASQLFMMLKDVESATKWAKEAHKFSTRCRGRNHAETRALAANVKQLERI